jgi:predicted transglutaminase-like cysteine proteinase
MRQTFKIFAVVAAIASACAVSSANAAFFSFPRMLLSAVDRINFDTPTLAPMAYTRFCLQYPEDCEVSRGRLWHNRAFWQNTVTLTEARWAELAGVNRDVNQAIRPQHSEAGVMAEEWLISPQAGDCKDYAVTKRHELLTRGWPSRALLLTEVVTSWGEHHLVLVVRTNDADLVLDNLNANIRPVSKTRYQWVRAQLPGNPSFWSTVSAPTSSRTLRTAMLSH